MPATQELKLVPVNFGNFLLITDREEKRLLGMFVCLFVTRRERTQQCPIVYQQGNPCLREIRKKSTTGASIRQTSTIPDTYIISTTTEKHSSQQNIAHTLPKSTWLKGAGIHWRQLPDSSRKPSDRYRHIPPGWYPLK